jgi:SAM-dependent methyltransferase
VPSEPDDRSEPARADLDAARATLLARFSSVERFELTSSGIFLPTPIPVLVDAVARLVTSGVLRPGARVLDAGAGDGRVVFAIATMTPAALAAGLESDPVLAEEARAHVAGVARAVVERGDMLDPASYLRLGVAVEELDLVLHYPDGNERALRDLLARRGKRGVTLALSTPQLGLVLPGGEALPIERHGSIGAWHWELHRPRP